MNRNTHTGNAELRRSGSVAVGLGTAAGAILVAVLTQLPGPPDAHADTTDFTNIINALDFSAGAGQNALIDASTDLFSGNVAGALANSFAAWDNYLLAPQYDLLVNGYADLTGITGFTDEFSFGILKIPGDLSAAAGEISAFVDAAQQSLTTASGEFAADNITGALTDLSIASEDLTEGVQVGLLGLTDTLLGIVPIE